MKKIFGIINLAKIDPYNNKDGFVIFYLSNSQTNDDYRLTIMQDDNAIGAAGEEGIDAKSSVSGRFNPYFIKYEWLSNGHIGIEMNLKNSSLYQREIGGFDGVKIGDVWTTLRLSEKKETDNNLPFSVY